MQFSRISKSELSEVNFLKIQMQIKRPESLYCFVSFFVVLTAFTHLQTVTVYLQKLKNVGGQRITESFACVKIEKLSRLCFVVPHSSNEVCARCFFSNMN